MFLKHLFIFMLYLNNIYCFKVITHIKQQRLKMMDETYNLYNAREYTFNVQNNSIIFFPSECHHRVLKHNSDVIRLSDDYKRIKK